MPVGACGPITIRASESRLLIGALAACLVLIGRPLSAFSAADEGRALLPGAPIEMELGQGAVRRHPIALEAGQLVEVTVREKGPRLAVVLLGPDGATVARRTVPSPRFTTIRMLAVTSAGGTHVLEVRSSAEEGRPGRYDVVLAEPHTPTDGERARVAAEEDLAQGATLADERDAKSRDQALARLAAAEAAFSEAGDRGGQATALFRLGHLQADLGQPAASASLERARATFHDLGDREGEAAVLLDLGWAQLRKGATDEARALFEQAAAQARATSNDWLLTAAVRNLGGASDRAGDAERAIDSYSEALALAVEVGSRYDQAGALNNMGVAYNHLGEREKAIECYERSRALSRASGRREDEASTASNLASLLIEEGEVDRALALLEDALPQARAAGARETEARILNNTAKALSRKGDHAQAIALGRQSLDLRRQIGDRMGEASTLHSLGRNLHRAGDLEGALDSLRQALELRRAMRDQSGEAWTLLAMANVERDRGQLHEGLVHAEAAVLLTESLRSAVTSPELRATFVAAEEDTYGIYVDVLARLHEQEPGAGYDAAALKASERARARVLLESLIEARADIRQGVDPALLQQERSLQKKMSDSAARLSRALAGDAAAGAARARADLEAASEEYRQVETRIRRESPGYAALTQPEPASVEEIRRDALDDQTVLLEFHLGRERSLLWALTRNTLDMRVLPAQAPIEEAARAVQALLTERQRTRRPDALRQADRRLATESLALSRLLLGGVADRLGGEWKGKRLLFVASGALAYLPLGALPSPVEGPARPLLAEHEIVSAPSASVLVALRRDRPAGAPTPPRVAVLADPVFDASDPRVHADNAADRTSPPPATGLRRALDSLGRARLSRLPFSREEARAIASLVPPSALLEATDFAATRALVTEGGVADRQILHIATHGLLDSGHPDLSGLVLSLVDERGAPRDGFLRMHEIYNLRLPAELVVLSACQTALGREIRGEGLVGLTRGFMYAGARRVVASLWEVDDESTAALMKTFYRSMLVEGLPPATALRRAQLALAQERRWSAPFYWAGFVLQGEWN